MKKVLFLLMQFAVATMLSAQGLSVSSFCLLETDVTAITPDTREFDQNGEVAALIKVATRETGFTFDIGVLGVVGTRQRAGEIWVYVPKRAQKISIFHQQYGIVRNYYFPVLIESGRTYELKLEVEKGEPQIAEKKVVLSKEESAFRSNLNRAESGDAAAQYYVGYALYNGIGVKQNYEEAFEWLTKAANQDENRAKYYLGLCYKNGTGVKKDVKEAFLYFQMASDKNVPEAMFQMGNMYYNGEAVKRNYKEAIKWYNRAVEADNMEAMCALGHCYKQGKGVKTDMNKAVRWYDRALEKDERKTFAYLGIKDCISDETRKEIRLALDSAIQGNVKYQFYVGKLFYEEKNAFRDDALASYWLDKAKKAWHTAYDQVLMGDFYIAIDKDEAFRWYVSAANKGSVEGLCRMGVCLIQGIGVMKDKKMGAEYIKEAAEKGNEEAMWQLGECYRLGTGVKKNQDEAQKWYEAAAKNGNTKAQLYLEENNVSGKDTKKSEE